MLLDRINRCPDPIWAAAADPQPPAGPFPVCLWLRRCLVFCSMTGLQDSLLELIRRTSAEIPEDVHRAIVGSLEREKQGTIAESAMKIIEQNIALAKSKSQPICQDTGSIIFYVDGSL